MLTVTSLRHTENQLHVLIQRGVGAGGPDPPENIKLEDLKVLRRSPDLLNNVKIGQGQLQLIMEHILFLPYPFWSNYLNNLMNNPSNSLLISEKRMFR